MARPKSRRLVASLEVDEFNEWSSETAGPSQRQDVDGGHQQLQAKRKRGRHSALTREEIDRKACELVRFVINSDHKKHPVKRADIVQSVMREQADAFLEVLEAAREKLKTIFGMNIVELRTRSNKFYILVDELSRDVLEDMDRSDSGPEMALLSVVLTLIFMNKGPLPEAELWPMLTTLGIKKDAVHEVFGRVTKVIEEFVKQMYLDCQKEVGADGRHLVYTWGARAKEELDPEDILKFVARMHEMDVELWRKQYEDRLQGREIA